MDPVTFKMAMQLLWSLLKTKKGRRMIVAITGILVLGVVAAIAIPAIFIAQLTQTTDTALRWRQAVMDGQCVSWNPETEGGRTDGLTSEQVSNARILWEVARQAKFPTQMQSRAAVVAIAAAMQESKLKNLDYCDADSLGILQQRPATGWGTKAQVTDVTKAALAFYGVAEHTHNPGLKQIRGWENMTVTQAAQAVQRSAFPNAYAQWETVARSLVASFEQTNQVQALTVMSYNLLGSRLYKVKWPTRSTYVSRLIHSASPDIIGFQENFSYGKGDRGQARLLDLPGYSWVAPDFRVAIAYKSSLGQVVDQGIIRLGTRGVFGSTHNRFAVWAKINTSAGGLLLVNVHVENGNRNNAAHARSHSWIEDADTAGREEVIKTMSSDPFEHLAVTARGRVVDLSEGPGVVDFGPPPPMRWVNVTDFAPPVMGSPVVVMATGQPAINRRAASEVFESNGGLYIRVVAEPRWWTWIESPADERTPWPARSRVVPAMHVWTQVES